MYTRDGENIQADVDSVVSVIKCEIPNSICMYIHVHIYVCILSCQVCDSPKWRRDTPVISLIESDLCSPVTTTSGPTGDFLQPLIRTTSAVTTPVTMTTSTAPPPTTTSTMTAASPTSASTTAPWTLQTELSIAHYTAVTWFWYHFTGASQTEQEASTAPFRPQSRNPTTARVETTTYPTTPTEWTTTEALSTRSTTRSTTHEDPLTQTIITTSSWVVNSVAQANGSRGTGVICFWLFLAYLIVFLALMVYVLVTLVKLVSWYKTMYQPLKLSSGRETVKLLSTNYRSVLLVHTGGNASEEVQEGENKARSHEEVQRRPVTLELTGIHRAPERGEQRGNVADALVYRKTVHRLISKEEELGAWSDVVEECWMTAKAGQKEEELKDEETDYARSGESVPGHCYSLILRQNVEPAGGGKEEVDWVIGGWKFKRDGREEEPVISWGQWLANYLPRMPWGLNPSPESRAASSGY